MPTDATVIAWQDADLAGLGIGRDEAEGSVQWIAPDGSVSSAQVAIGRLLRDAGTGWALLGRIILAPAVSPIAGVVYRFVAEHRSRLPGGTPACALPVEKRPGTTRRSAPERPGS